MKFVFSTAFCPLHELPELAVVADEAGWHGISFSDHVVHPKELTKTPYPYTDDGERRWPAFTEWPDPMVMLGGLATITKNIEFMNNIFVLPMRNPFLVAKSVATAAVLSNNRVNLCIGVGWSKDEFELLGQDFHTRGKRCNEAIEIMQALFEGGWVSYEGEHYQFEPLEMSPVPSKPVPIWVGGISKPALRRAARYGNGWVTDLQSSADIIESIEYIKLKQQEYGRENIDLQVMATPNDAFTKEQYQDLEASGVTHILMQPWHLYYQGDISLEQKITSLQRYATDYFA